MSDETPPRAYCWRTGGITELRLEWRCTECGGAHKARDEDGTCGAFAPCEARVCTAVSEPGGTPRIEHVARRDHGHPCFLPEGHAGPHRCEITLYEAAMEEGP